MSRRRLRARSSRATRWSRLRQRNFKNAEKIQREDEHDDAHERERNRDW